MHEYHRLPRRGMIADLGSYKGVLQIWKPQKQPKNQGFFSKLLSTGQRKMVYRFLSFDETHIICLKSELEKKKKITWALNLKRLSKIFLYNYKEVFGSEDSSSDETERKYIKVGMEFVDPITFNPDIEEGKENKVFHVEQSDFEGFSYLLELELRRAKNIKVRCYFS